MALIRWQPRQPMKDVQEWSPFRDLDLFREEMGRLFGWPSSGTRMSGQLDHGWAPAVDVIQEEDRFHVRADLPGMKREDIQITLDGDTLGIAGEKKSEHEEKHDGFYREERSCGTFSRIIVLPASVDSDRIEASYRDGVLDVVIPKSDSAKPKQIKIQS